MPEGTGCRAGVGILSDHIVEQVEHYRVAELGYNCVGALEQHIADWVGKVDTVAEVDQIAADIFELEAQVQDTAGRLAVVEETSYDCYYTAIDERDCEPHDSRSNFNG